MNTWREYATHTTKSSIPNGMIQWLSKERDHIYRLIMARKKMTIRFPEVMQDKISEAIINHLERVIKKRQIFPDLIKAISGEAMWRYNAHVKRKETHKPDWF